MEETGQAQHLFVSGIMYGDRCAVVGISISEKKQANLGLQKV